MRPLIKEIQTAHSPETLLESLRGEPGLVLLRTGKFHVPAARYSFVTARPFLTFRSFGAHCETIHHSPLAARQSQFGNPWHLLEALMSRFELLDEIDSPFPLGGAFGYWGYDLKNFTEPKLRRRAVNDMELPDCHAGFYDCLAAFDHRLGRVSLISTGQMADGSRNEGRALERLEFWEAHLMEKSMASPAVNAEDIHRGTTDSAYPVPRTEPPPSARITSNLSRADFISAVQRAQKYIHAGDIYQANLSHRLTARWNLSGWELFQNLLDVSPAPYAAYLDCDGGSRSGRFQIASSSPEQFLLMRASHIMTRPIKGTRPRAAEGTQDAQLAYELQTNPKELAELVMITDLMRNDLGKICEYGSVYTAELARLEKFAQVQHLVSTVEGRLRNDVTHSAALASCFPGGSVTGAPKFRAMEIIDELEPLSRGPYCGAIGYLGFNRESQMSIAIRTAICQPGIAHFNVGAGIVADSIPEAEYEETLAKARGFMSALELGAAARAPEIPIPNQKSNRG